MAIRTYQCSKGHSVERINAPDTVKCPTCGAKAKAVEWEVPARRNPAHGIQTEMK